MLDDIFDKNESLHLALQEHEKPIKKILDKNDVFHEEKSDKCL